MNEPHENYFLQNMLVLNIYALNLNNIYRFNIHRQAWKAECRNARKYDVIAQVVTCNIFFVTEVDEENLQ